MNPFTTCTKRNKKTTPKPPQELTGLYLDFKDPDMAESYKQTHKVENEELFDLFLKLIIVYVVINVIVEYLRNPKMIVVVVCENVALLLVVVLGKILKEKKFYFNSDVIFFLIQLISMFFLLEYWSSPVLLSYNCNINKMFKYGVLMSLASLAYSYLYEHWLFKTISF